MMSALFGAGLDLRLTTSSFMDSSLWSVCGPLWTDMLERS